MHPFPRLSVAVLCTCLLFHAKPVRSESGLPLSVRAESGAVVELSLEDLDGLSQASFETTTIWTDGSVAFSGVALADVLEAANADGDTLRMTALNDYSVEMSIDEISSTFPIIATRMNGQEISVRDKGPYWVVFPYDSNPEFQTETTYARSIWQLRELSIVD